MRRDQVVASCRWGARSRSAPAPCPERRPPRRSGRRARPRAPGRVEPVIGVDVLADQRDLAHAGAGETPDLGQDRLRRAARPRRRGCRARRRTSRTCRSPPERSRRRRRRAWRPPQARSPAGGRTCPRRETRCRRRRAAASRLAQKLGQAVIALRTDDHVHRRLAAQDLGALGLGDAAGDDDRRPAAGLRARLSLSSRSLPSSE